MAALTPAGTDPDALWKAYAAGRGCRPSRTAPASAGSSFDAARLPRRRRSASASTGSACSRDHRARSRSRTPGSRSTDDNRDARRRDHRHRRRPDGEHGGVLAAGVIEEGAAAANPAVFPNTVYNAAGGQVAMKVGPVGPASTVTAGHAAGASALCYAFDLPSRDQADAVLCVAADALTDTVMEAYAELGVLATSEPARRRGFALAEAGGRADGRAARAGAGARRAHLRRGARLRHHLRRARASGGWTASGEGIERAMRVALERAGVSRTTSLPCGRARCGLTGRPTRPSVRRSSACSASDVDGARAEGQARRADGRRRRAQRCARAEGLARAARAGRCVVNSLSLGGTNFSVVLAPFTS